jgi:hypothetical protein
MAFGTCSTFLFRRSVQVSLAEQTESAAAVHATLVRLSRRLKSDNLELSALKADTDKALNKAQQQETKLRLQLQTSEEALSRANAAIEQASKQQKDELRQMGDEMRRRLEGEMARGGAKKQQLMEVR